MNEIWKDIVGYEGCYQVSNLGNVKSFISTYNGNRFYPKELILRQYSNKGYLRVALTDSFGKVKYYLVHRLVLTVFLGYSELDVNHIDGNKKNNRVENLEWVTKSENQIHAYKTGLQNPADNGFKKAITIIKNGVVIGQERSIRELCRKYGLDRRHLQRVIRNGKSYKKYNFELI